MIPATEMRTAEPKGAEGAMADGGGKKVRFNLMVEPELLEGLDELRKREMSPMPTRAEMLRRLIRRALAAPAVKKPS